MDLGPKNIDYLLLYMVVSENDTLIVIWSENKTDQVEKNITIKAIEHEGAWNRNWNMILMYVFEFSLN